MAPSLTLRPVDRENVRAVCRLALAPGQEAYVAPAAVTVAESQFEPGGWLRAAYLGDAAVGLVWVVPQLPGPPFVQRFMVDAAHQRGGLGRELMRQVIAHFRAAGAPELQLSYWPGDLEPLGFYLKCGFESTGEMRDGEHVMCFPLLPSRPVPGP